MIIFAYIPGIGVLCLEVLARRVYLLLQEGTLGVCFKGYVQNVQRQNELRM
jgi:hypothetical protein